MGNKIVPVDVPSAVSIGIEEWCDNFEFPVDTREYLNWENLFRALLDKNIFLNPDPIHRDIFNSQYELFVSIIPNILHAYVVFCRLRHFDKKLSFSNVKKYEHYNYYKFIFDEDYTLGYVKLPSFKSRLKQWLNNGLLIKTFFSRNFKFVYTGKTSLFKKCSDDLPSPLEKSFFKGSNSLVLIKPPSAWLNLFNLSFSSSTPLNKSVYEAIDEFIDLFRDCLISNQLSVDNLLVEKLKRYVAESIETTHSVMMQMRRTARKLKDAPCFFSGAGNWLNRTIALAIQREGGHVSVFNHGGEPGKILHHLFYYVYFPIADTLYTYSQRSAQCLNRIKTYCDKDNVYNTEVKSLEYTEYARLLEKYSRFRIRKDIKSVMIIGYPATLARWTATPFTLYMLLIEIRIIRALKKAGYTVIYKKHQDTTPEIKQYEDMNIKIINKRFEDEEVLDASDAFIFTHSLTTTFPIALCTRKPVILFNDPYTKWDKDCLEAVRKRCAIIDLKEEKNGSFSFDEGQLLQALKEPYKTDDPSFINNFLCPVPLYGP